jgi:hypothetical protein
LAPRELFHPLMSLKDQRVEERRDPSPRLSRRRELQPKSQVSPIFGAFLPIPVCFESSKEILLLLKHISPLLKTSRSSNADSEILKVTTAHPRLGRRTRNTRLSKHQCHRAKRRKTCWMLDPYVLNISISYKPCTVQIASLFTCCGMIELSRALFVFFGEHLNLHQHSAFM